MYRACAYHTGIFAILVILTTLQTATAKARRHDCARGHYGQGASEGFFGPAGIVVSDASGPFFVLSSFGRCNPTNQANCSVQDLSAAVDEPNFIYFYQIRLLRNVTAPITFTLSAVFDVPSVTPALSNLPPLDQLDTTVYGIIQNDQTNISACHSLPFNSADYNSCIQNFIDDTDSAVDTTQTKLTLKSGLQLNDTILVHLDSYLPPSCLASGSTPALVDCVPNATMNVNNATTPSSQLVVVGPDAASSTTPDPQISFLVPSFIAANSLDTDVTVTGSGFDSSSVFRWNGQTINPKVTPTATELVATVPAAFFGASGVSRVTVTKASGGTTSESNPLAVEIQNQTPLSLDGISVSSVPQGSPTFNLVMNGSNFLPNSVVELSSEGSTCLNDGITANRPALFISPSQIQVTIYDTDLLTPHLSATNTAYSLYVFTQPADGDCSAPPSSMLSGPQTFTVESGPVVQLNPTGPISFGAQSVGTVSAAQSVTLTNVGSALLNLSTISVSGNRAMDFVLGTASGSCSVGLSIAASSACTISVTYKPLTAGSSQAALTISDNAPGSPRIVSLVGSAGDFRLPSSDSSTLISSIGAGGTATYTIPLTSINNFAGSVAFTCGDHPSGTNCTISPNPANLPSGGTVNIMVTVAPTPSAALLPADKGWPRFVNRSPLFLAFAFVVLLLFGPYTLERRRHICRQLSIGVAVCLSLMGGSCGGAQPNQPQVFPKPGTYQIPITASSGGDIQSVTLTLTVK